MVIYRLAAGYLGFQMANQARTGDLGKQMVFLASSWLPRLAAGYLGFQMVI